MAAAPAEPTAPEQHALALLSLGPCAPLSPAFAPSHGAAAYEADVPPNVTYVPVFLNVAAADARLNVTWTNAVPPAGPALDAAQAAAGCGAGPGAAGVPGVGPGTRNLSMPVGVGVNNLTVAIEVVGSKARRDERDDHRHGQAAGPARAGVPREPGHRARAPHLLPGLRPGVQPRDPGVRRQRGL